MKTVTLVPITPTEIRLISGQRTEDNTSRLIDCRYRILDTEGQLVTERTVRIETISPQFQDALAAIENELVAAINAAEGLSG